MNRLLTTAAAIALTASMGIAPALAAGHSAALPFPTGEDDRFSWGDLDQFQDMDFSGETVTMFGPWLGPDKDLVESMVAYFEEATGADVQYSGSDGFEQQILIDLEGGSPPNIAVFPQPGLMATMAERGFLTELSDDTKSAISSNYAAGDSWVALGSAEVNGEEGFYAVPYKADVKSLVWYNPDNFADFGYEVPETMEDLIALSEQMVEDGNTPWCIGLGSGAATGWPATDWVEDIMLRTVEPEVYDQWVNHEIPFNDERVVNAIETFGTFAKNEDFVKGGGQAVAGTDFRESPKGLFASPPECFMHKQASFIPTFFPEGTQIGTDADFFYFPAFESEDLGQPVLGAGTFFAMAKQSEATEALLQYLTTALAQEVWLAQGGMLSPHTGVDLALYPNDAARGQAEILTNASTFRFDGSDLMPGAVGAGSFWTGMVDYVTGTDAQAAADQIEQSWQSAQ